jgi:hypothetical protein
MPIEKAELIKIVITAVVTLVARELLSWFIRTTRRLAMMLKTKIIPWINKDAKRFDLILQGLSCIWFFWIFFFIVGRTDPVTIGSMKTTVFIGGVLFMELHTFFVKFRRFFD